MTSPRARNSTKRNWHRGVLNLLRKTANFLQSVIHILGKIISLSIDLTVYLFTVIVRIGVAPATPILFSIALVVTVFFVTFDQWRAIGVWGAGLVGIPSGIGALVGLLIGGGINSFQLAPKLRNLSRSINRAYVHLKVDLNYEPGEQDTPEEREQNWLNISHRKLKIVSAISYCVETALVIFHFFLGTNLDVWSLCRAAISLLMPEFSLSIANYQIQLLGAVSRAVANEEPPESEVNL